MKKRFNYFIVLLCLLPLFIGGCGLETNEPKPTKPPTGNGVVINELYVIPPDRYYSYSWLELYNTDTASINLLSITPPLPQVGDTAQLEIFVFTVVTELRVIAGGGGGYIAAVDTAEKMVSALGTVETVPGTIMTLPTILPRDAVLLPGKFYVITNNQNRFESHFRLGPYDPELIEIPFLTHIVQTGPTEFFGGLAYWYPMSFGQITLQQILLTILRIPPIVEPFPDNLAMYVVLSSEVIKTFDAVRYGDYKPSPDSTPGNIPVGFIPEFKSLARYSGYYKTGNTRDAFYIADDPIPGWYSQRQKR